MFQTANTQDFSENSYDFPVPASLSDFREALPQTRKEDIICDRPDFGYRMVVRIAPGVAAKYCPEGVAEEALCMQLAATLPIPVPRVLWYPGNPRTRYVLILYSSARNVAHFCLLHRVPEDGNALANPDWVWCIYMDEVPGVSLYKVLDSLSDDVLRSLGKQLREIVDHIASIKSPTGTISATDDGPLRTFIAPAWVQPEEAFTSNDAFVAWVTDLFARCDTPRPIARAYAEERLAHLAGPAEVRFTHGDLVPKNIMVSADGTRITGIIDWGNAGYYPDYWERARMHDPCHMAAFPGWKTILEAAWPEEDSRLEAPCVVREVLNAVSLTF